MAPSITEEPSIDGAAAGAGVAEAPRVFPRSESRARLNALIAAGGRAGLARGRWGLEREGLRVEADGRPALTPHPFGPEERAITVDFAEAQAELITAPCASPEAAWAELSEAHRRLRARLGEELFWPLSLPGRWDEPERLRAAEFGGRPEDAGARAYRAELLRRHGRARQAISGVHYNFSFDAELLAALRRADGATGPEREWRDGIYFGVMRNFLRHQHVFNALWGMSPPEDEAFWHDLRAAAGGKSRAEADRCAGVISSVRLSPLGYGLAPDVAEALGVDFSSLDAYVERLGAAVLRGGVLAHEREFYSPVRPKTVAGGAGEEKNEAGASLQRLAREGVGYLEFRVFDLDPFEANGVGLEVLRFFHVLVLASLLRPAERIGPGERAELTERWRWSTLCGGRWCECRPSPGAAGEREILPLLEFMAEIAAELPPGYAAAVAAARERWAGRRDRPLDRWRRLVAATPGGALATGLGLARAHATGTEAATPDTPGREERSDDFMDTSNLELSTQAVIAEAQRRGVEVEVLDAADNFIVLRRDGRTEYVKQATRTSADTYVSALLMENKAVTKLVLTAAGLRAPVGARYDHEPEAAGDFARYAGRRIVVKPNATNFGEGVALLGADAGEAEYRAAVTAAFALDRTVLVEEFVAGREFRFLVIGGATRAVLHRVPANVTGDGVSDITALVAEKNRDPKRGEGYRKPLEKIRLGEVETAFLAGQGLTAASVPTAGEQVYLRKNSNISTGGDSIDFTDTMPAVYQRLAERATAAAGANICGLDMIIPDVTDAREDAAYSILELNFNPALHIHDYPAVGENRRVERFVLDQIGFGPR